MNVIKTTLATMCLTASCGAFAHEGHKHHEASESASPAGFTLGVSGLYGKPSDSNGDFDFANVNTGNTATGFNNEIARVDPGYAFGWGVFAGYQFAGTDNDLALSYFHYSNSTTETKEGVVEPLNVGGAVGTYDLASAKFNVDANVVDLELGQTIAVGERLTVHPTAGLRWASLERRLKPNFFSSTGDLYTKDESRFSGLGPIVGLDASYKLCCSGFSVVAHAAASLLVGDLDAKLSVFDSAAVSDSGDVGLKSDFEKKESQRMVPTLEAKLGVNYAFPYAQDDKVIVEAGWAFSNFFNVIDGVAGSTSTTGGSVAGNDTTDASLQGPYVNLAVAF